jgi:GntR family phosphonate transport system transcriptional regulator
MSLYAVERDSPEALYAQIARRLELEITHLYKAGAALPPETELAGRFGVNRHTLRRAVDELVAAGMLERRHGRGVFVVDGLLDYKLAAGTRFTETLNALGKSTDSKVVRKLIVPASARIAERLAIAFGEPTIWIETLRLAEDYPLCVISHFLPARKYRQVFDDYAVGSLHRFLETRYGCVLRRTESLVTALLPQGDDAKLLGIAQNRPVLRVKSLNVDSRYDSPVEYALTRFRADRIQLRVNP